MENEVWQEKIPCGEVIVTQDYYDRTRPVSYVVTVQIYTGTGTDAVGIEHIFFNKKKAVSFATALARILRPFELS